MKQPRRLSRTLALIAATLAMAALLPTLSGCSAENSIFSSIANLFGDDYDLTGAGERELDRFRAVYSRYAVPGSENEDEQLKHFADAFKRVRADYVREVSDAELIDAAVDGLTGLEAEPTTLAPSEAVEAGLDAMLASLDPHSSYLNSEELREMQVSNKGEFGGLGIEITMEDDLVKVVSPIEGTPASRAGLKPGDLITHIDGASVRGKSLMEAVRGMRGRPGTDIRLTIQRADRRPFDVTITRAIISIKSVRWSVEGDFGYVRVASFTEKTASGIDEAMRGIRSGLGSRLRGFVLDLRNNPGGLLDQSLALADAFLERGTIVGIRGRGERSSSTIEAEPGDLAAGLPVVVLINGGSASASEIVAGALKDNRRATIMGRRSFGKGTVQTIIPLPLEGAVRLTTQLYYSPTGRAIQAHGVVPDIAIVSTEDSPLKREADLPGAIEGDGTSTGIAHDTVDEAACPVEGTKDDPMLGCALAFLRAGSADRFLALVGSRPRS